MSRTRLQGYFFVCFSSINQSSGALLNCRTKAFVFEHVWMHACNFIYVHARVCVWMSCQAASQEQRPGPQGQQRSSGTPWPLTSGPYVFATMDDTVRPYRMWLVLLCFLKAPWNPDICRQGKAGNIGRGEAISWAENGEHHKTFCNRCWLICSRSYYFPFSKRVLIFPCSQLVFLSSSIHPAYV